jgi:hypothetical protein
MGHVAAVGDDAAMESSWALLQKNVRTSAAGTTTPS